MPEDGNAFLEGQCATAVFVAASRLSSSSETWTLWASTEQSRSNPVL